MCVAQINLLLDKETGVMKMKKLCAIVLATAMSFSMCAFAEETNDALFTSEEQEAIVQSVKDSVTEMYLEKYGITPSDFELSQYNVDDIANYNDGNYSGEDPYSCTSVWLEVDMAITSGDTNYSVLEDLDKETAAMIGIFTIESTLDEQLSTMLVGSDLGYLDNSEESKDLLKSVYFGVASFLNNLDEQRRAEIIVNCYYNAYKDNPLTEINGRMYPQETMFDKIITENITFE